MKAKGDPIPWGKAKFTWNSSRGITPTGQDTGTVKNIPYTWDDVYFVLDLIGEPYNPLSWSKEKKKRFVQLLCKVKDIEYKESKEVEEVEIFISDIALVAKEVAGIEIQIEV